MRFPARTSLLPFVAGSLALHGAVVELAPLDGSVTIDARLAVAPRETSVRFLLEVPASDAVVEPVLDPVRAPAEEEVREPIEAPSIAAPLEEVTPPTAPAERPEESIPLYALGPSPPVGTRTGPPPPVDVEPVAEPPGRDTPPQAPPVELPVVPAPPATPVDEPSGDEAEDSAALQVEASPDATLCPPPEYPRIARVRHLEGTVLLEVDVSSAGTPLEVRIWKSSGHQVLDRAALEAVRAWRFRPAHRGGRAEESTVRVPVTFRLVD